MLPIISRHGSGIRVAPSHDSIIPACHPDVGVGGVGGSHSMASCTAYKHADWPAPLQAFESPMGHQHKRFCVYVGGLTDGLLACSYVEVLGPVLDERGWALVQPSDLIACRLWMLLACQGRRRNCGAPRALDEARRARCELCDHRPFDGLPGRSHLLKRRRQSSAARSAPPCCKRLSRIASRRPSSRMGTTVRSCSPRPSAWWRLDAAKTSSARNTMDSSR